MRQGMRFDCGAIAWANVDIDADNTTSRGVCYKRLTRRNRLAIVKQHQHRRTHDQRPTVCDACFNYQIWPDAPNYFLQCDDILWKLDDGAPKARKMVSVFVSSARNHELIGEPLQGGVA